jgi:hypothetical protein
LKARQLVMRQNAMAAFIELEGRNMTMLLDRRGRRAA